MPLHPEESVDYLPDGTIVCSPHHRALCHICCVDFTDLARMGPNPRGVSNDDDDDGYGTESAEEEEVEPGAAFDSRDKVPVLAGGMERYVPQWDDQLLGPKQAAKLQRDYRNPLPPLPPSHLQFSYCSNCNLTWLVKRGYQASHPSHETAWHFSGSTCSLVVWADGACPWDGSVSATAGVGVSFGRQSRYNLSERITAEHVPPTSQAAELHAALCALQLIHTRIMPNRRKLCYAGSMNPVAARHASHLRVILTMDSSYVVNGMCKFIENWVEAPDGGFANAHGKKVGNGEGFLRLRNAVERLSGVGAQVVWYHVAREFNVDADRLAHRGAAMAQQTGVISVTKVAHSGFAVTSSGSTPVASTGLAVSGSAVLPNRAPAASDPSKPTVLILCISELKDMFHDIHVHLLSALRSRANVLEAITLASAHAQLSHRNLQAVILADAAIVEQRNGYKQLRRRLVQYAQSGGTVILAGLFSSFMQPSNFAGYMEESWDLSWTFGAYTRKLCFYSPSTAINRMKNGRVFKLPTFYSQKAIFLKGVPHGLTVYKSRKNAKTDHQTPIAFTRVGEGYLGFVGDVNAEEGTTAVILAMCNLDA